jgi:hypothetical protein
VDPLAFCVWLKARMKSSRSCMERRSGAPFFFVCGDARAESNRSREVR